MYNQQLKYDIKFDWGLNGLYNLSKNSDIIIIIDVLSFSTCVDIALNNGGIIFPFDETCGDINKYALDNSAVIANKDRQAGSFSLSPGSMMNIKNGDRVILPSPNGSSLSLKSNCSQTICGCLRNAVSIAGFLNEGNYRIGIIAAGEKWNDGSIRYCIEDYIGAGSIISNINGKKSPEASLAEITYKNLTDSVYNIIKCSCSGLELEDRGFINDVELACRENTSSAVPLLFENKYYKNIK